MATWHGLASIPYQHGDMAAVIDICRTALDTISGTPTAARALLVGELGWAEVGAGRPAQGRPHLEKAAEAVRVDPMADPVVRARILDRMAVARSECGDDDAAMEASADAFRALPPGRPGLHAILRLHRGKLLARVGRPEEGLGDVLAARRVFQSQGDHYSTSITHWTAAEILDDLGLPERGLAERRWEIALLDEIRNARNAASALIHSARLLRQLGRWREANRMGQRALGVALETGDPRLVSWAREVFGKTARS